MRILAVLYLMLHNKVSAWKTIDWKTMQRLHDKGLISDPVGKQKSIFFSEEELLEAERRFRKLLAKD